jgi:hypothetical protein
MTWAANFMISSAHHVREIAYLMTRTLSAEQVDELNIVVDIEPTHSTGQLALHSWGAVQAPSSNGIDVETGGVLNIDRCGNANKELSGNVSSKTAHASASTEQT